MLRVSISLARHDPGTYADVEQIIGHNRIFSQGTDRTLYVDFARREWADLAMVNLNTIQGVRAKIEGDHA